jgi:hypothetical protein
LYSTISFGSSFFLELILEHMSQCSSNLTLVEKNWQCEICDTRMDLCFASCICSHLRTRPSHYRISPRPIQPCPTLCCIKEDSEQILEAVTLVLHILPLAQLVYEWLDSHEECQEASDVDALLDVLENKQVSRCDHFDIPSNLLICFKSFFSIWQKSEDYTKDFPPLIIQSCYTSAFNVHFGLACSRVFPRFDLSTCLDRSVVHVFRVYCRLSGWQSTSYIIHSFLAYLSTQPSYCRRLQHLGRQINPDCVGASAPTPPRM